MGRRKLKILKIAAIIVLSGAIGMVLMPVWFPWVLRPALRSQGVQFGNYERLGFTRLALHDVKFHQGKVQFTAREIETVTPPAWMWQHRAKPDNTRPLLRVDGAGLSFDTSQPSTNGDRSFHTAIEKTGRVLKSLQRWLPAATATDSTISFGTNRVAVANLTWQQNTLTARASWIGRVPESSFQLTINRDTRNALPARLTADCESLGIAANLNLLRRHQLPHVEGRVSWPGGSMELEAQFDLASPWPQTARTVAVTDRLSSLGYTHVSTELAMQWQTNRFRLELTATAHPSDTNSFSPPAIEASAAASGDTEHTRIERATVSIPGFEARLQKAVEIDFSERRYDEATFHLLARLDELPPLRSKGIVDGHVSLKGTRPDFQLPVLEFSASVATATIAGISVGQAKVRGNVDLERRVMSDAVVEADILPDSPWLREISGTVVAGRLETGAALRPAITFESLSITARASGALNQLKHEGEAAVKGLKTSALHGVDISTRWRGESLSVGDCNITAKMSDLSLEVNGSVNVLTESKGINARVRTATLQQDDKPLLSLVSPAKIVVGRTQPGGQRHVSFQAFDWSGGGGELELDVETSWPESGRVEAVARSISPAVWSWRTNSPLTDTQIELCNLSAAWSNSPVNFQFAATAQTKVNKTNRLRAELRLTGGDEGVEIEKLAVFAPAGSALTATGVLPVTFEPARTDGIVIAHDETPLSVELAISPDALFWNRVADWTGVRLVDPVAAVSVTGTLSNLQGRVHARAASAEVKAAMGSLPKISELRAEAAFSSTNAALTTFAARIEEQPFQLSASVPLEVSFWKQPLRSEHWPTREQLTARVEVANVSVAAFSRFLPQILSPQGHLDMDLTMLPGMYLSGTLNLSNAATRGMLPSGPIRDVQASVKFDGRRAEIQRFSGELARQVVVVSGYSAWNEGCEPEVVLRLQGRRIPLARQPGFILRADVDLSLVASNASTPTVTGIVKLRDSFYLAELRSLMPGRAQTPLQRPPYFSVTNQPYADWNLRVKIEGRRGLRVRTPLFRGVMSPDLSLGGTLREPTAIGEARVDEGRVQFPFCSIKIEQGQIVLTEDNPYRPELFVAGSARAFDYDLQLHANGFADDLHWEMSSNPPLSPEAIVLLVTAGEVPSNAVTFSERQRAGRLMFFLGRNLFSELWLEDSVADRLVVRSGESVTRTGRETYSVEYQLGDRWTLVGEYDQFNDVNAGLKWRVYSK